MHEEKLDALTDAAHELGGEMFNAGEFDEEIIELIKAGNFDDVVIERAQQLGWVDGSMF